MKIRLNPFLAASIICIPLADLSVHGATAVKGAAGSDLSSTAAGIWSGGGGTNGAPTSSDKATWDATSITGALSVSSAVNWAQIEFTSTLAADTTISGSDITLSSIATEGSGSSTYPFLNSANRLVTINNNIGFNSDGRRHTISSNAGTLTLAGNINGNGTLWLRGSSANSVASGTITGVTQLTKVDAGTWALTQANTINAVKIGGGGFLLGNDAALGNGTMTIDNGTSAATATLGVVSGSGARTLANNITIGGLTGNTLAVNTANGNITLNGNVTDSGALSLKLTKSSANTLTLAGSASNFSGGTTISGGAITVGHNGALGTGSAANSIAAGASLNLNTGITLAQTGVITMAASGNTSGNRSTINLAGTAAFSNNIQLDYLGLTGSGNAFAQIAGTGAGAFNGSVTFATGKANATAANNVFVLRGTGSIAKATGMIDLLTGNSTGVGILRIVDGGAAWELSGTGNRWTTLDFNSSTAAQRLFVDAANTLSAEGVLTNTNTSAGSIGTLNLRNIANTAGFNQTVAGINDGATGKVAVTSTQAATLTIGGAGTYASSGLISGSVTLIKSGAGNQTLTGANTYTGTTTIKAGTLKLDGAGSIDGSSSITVGDAGSSGAVLDVTTKTTDFTVGGSQTLGGIGTVNAAGKKLIIDGAIAPGNSAGLLSVSTISAADGLAFGSTGALNIEMTRGVPPSAGSNYDQLALTGGLTLAPGAALNLASLGLGSWTLNDMYFLIANDGTDAITGTFAGLGEGAVISFDSQQFKATYLADSDSNSFAGGNDFALQVVPEPNVAALLGGFGALALLRRRRA